MHFLEAVYCDTFSMVSLLFKGDKFFMGLLVLLSKTRARPSSTGNGFGLIRLKAEVDRCFVCMALRHGRRYLTKA